MNRSLRIEPEAQAELDATCRWYDSKHPGLGAEFLETVDAAINHLARWPRAGSLVPGVPVDLPVRRVPTARFSYHFVYLETPHALRILAIAHDRRHPGYWQARIKK